MMLRQLFLLLAMVASLSGVLALIPEYQGEMVLTEKVSSGSTLFVTGKTSQ